MINLGETFTCQLTVLLVHTRPTMFYISLVYVLLVEPPPDKHWYYTAVLSCTWSDSTTLEASFPSPQLPQNMNCLLVHQHGRCLVFCFIHEKGHLVT